MTSKRWKIIHSDCRKALRELSDCSVDAIVTDPPYELGFMGKAWDATGIAYSVDVWRECLRVLKHGGHLLAFGGSRTYHRLAVAIEDAGFQIRDQIMWVYGSGFPKSLDVSKAIDKQAGAERETVSETWRGDRAGTSAGIMGKAVPRTDRVTLPATDAAKQWAGWGTALKPAHEPIVLARKELDGTVAQNVIWYGTGALNIDGCRIATNEKTKSAGHFRKGSVVGDERARAGMLGDGAWVAGVDLTKGRFPANLIHDGSEEVLELFPDSKGGAYPHKRGQAVVTAFASGQETEGGFRKMGDDGSAARFFYCAKANKTDRNEGLDAMPEKDVHRYGAGIGEGKNPEAPAKDRNHHPTVKPTMLMRYLCRLITPPAGLVLDPFTGSGSTGKAAMLEGMRFVGIEQSEEYVRIAEARIKYAEDNSQ